MNRRVLVAGIGNIFLGDDGFGVEVVARLSAYPLPDWVKVADFGIRGVHLAYELLDGYDLAILVDATPRGGEPGTVYVIEPGEEAGALDEETGAAALIDAHNMAPGAVLGMLAALGGRTGRILVVGCEPALVEESIGLSPAVNRAVDLAIEMIRDLLAAEGARLGDPGLDRSGDGSSRKEH